MFWMTEIYFSKFCSIGWEFKIIKVTFAQFYFLSGIKCIEAGKPLLFFRWNHPESLQKNNISEAFFSVGGTVI